MKPLPETPSDAPRLLAFGAHPDDLEFGCGAILALEGLRGSRLNFVVCSQGESATHGTPEDRRREAKEGADQLGASLEFVDLGGDAHLERSVSHALSLAAVIRRVQPQWVLAPTLVENQHPDHAVLGSLVRDAARLARYGGVAELKSLPPHSIDQLFYYAVGPEGEPREVSAVWVDVSAPSVLERWKRAMNAHVTQAKTRDYVELQLTRARLLGLRAGVHYAQALYPADPIVISNLTSLGLGARRF
ncbi:MAG TPA: PIG-L family deacetylase [Opitutaceae bacterium]|nr:PIG-L family deacetylase [Opitutaceae bacterium]